MWHVWERRQMHAGFWWGNLRERDHFKYGRRWDDNIKIDLKQQNEAALTALIWLGTGAGGEVF
jgi:hypothetical protein